MIHRQQDYPGGPQKYKKPKSSHRRNQKKDYRTGGRKMEHRIHVDKGPRRALWK
jgi:hypothetical protein